MFTQLQAHRDRTHGGLGIGLTLVAPAGASCTAARSRRSSDGPGRGSQFTVRLPLATDRRSVAKRAPDASAARRSRGCRVLVAEDNPDAAEMMQPDARASRVTMSASPPTASEAVAIGERVRAADRVRRHRHAARWTGTKWRGGFASCSGRRVVLVALTGWGQDEDRRRSREAGFDHHLTKPPEPEVLEQLIAECAQPAHDATT